MLFYDLRTRYCIQIMFLTDDEPRWQVFYRARSRATVKGAREEWWHWVNYDWNDANRLPIFRVYDTWNKVSVEP